MATKRTVEGFVIRSVQLNRSEGKVTFADVPDRPGICSTIFGELGKNDINVNLIVQNSDLEGMADITFTVPRDQLASAVTVCEEVNKAIGGAAVRAEDNIATLSVIGVGMRSHTDVAARMFSTLARHNVNIDLISTSEIQIECVISGDQAELARRVLREEFKAELE